MLDGGELRIDWREDEAGAPGHVLMSGAVAVEFTGVLPLP